MSDLIPVSENVKKHKIISNEMYELDIYNKDKLKEIKNRFEDTFFTWVEVVFCNSNIYKWNKINNTTFNFTFNKGCIVFPDINIAVVNFQNAFNKKNYSLGIFSYEKKEIKDFIRKGLKKIEIKKELIYLKEEVVKFSNINFEATDFPVPKIQIENYDRIFLLRELWNILDKEIEKVVSFKEIQLKERKKEVEFQRQMLQDIFD